MTVITTIECDMEGTKCHKKQEKPKGSTPDKWAVVQGKKRIDFCPPCMKHARQQLAGQS